MPSDEQQANGWGHLKTEYISGTNKYFSFGFWLMNSPIRLTEQKLFLKKN